MVQAGTLTQNSRKLILFQSALNKSLNLVL